MMRRWTFRGSPHASSGAVGIMPPGANVTVGDIEGTRSEPCRDRGLGPEGAGAAETRRPRTPVGASNQVVHHERDRTVHRNTRPETIGPELGANKRDSPPQFDADAFALGESPELAHDGDRMPGDRVCQATLSCLPTSGAVPALVDPQEACRPRSVGPAS